MDVILDYMELNLRDQHKLPEFPKEFHSKIAELSTTAFLSYNMRIDTIKMYTVIVSSSEDGAFFYMVFLARVCEIDATLRGHPVQSLQPVLS